jgi:hypothetical protein
MKRTDAEILARARALVRKQAADEGLWFEAETAPEAYLQSALTMLHTTIGNDRKKPRRTNAEIAEAEGEWWKCPLCDAVRVTPGGDLRCPTETCPENFKLITSPERQLARLKREGKL